MPNMTNKAALKQKIMAMMSNSGVPTAEPAASPEPAPAPTPAPVYGPQTMMGPQAPSYFSPADRQQQVSRDMRNIAVYEGGRYRGMDNEEVDPGSTSYVYADAPGEYYEKPTKLVRKGKYATKK